MRSSTNELQNAIYDIFGEEQQVWNLANLPDLSLLKKEFYRRAMSCHPDRSQIVGRTSRQLTEEFKNINASYDLLQNLIIERKASYANSQVRDDNGGFTSPHRQADDGIKSSNQRESSFWNNIGLPAHKLRFCQFLFYSGLIDWKTIIDALVWQSAVRPKVGKIGMELGYLTAEDVVVVIKNRQAGEKFCESAVNQGKLSSYQSTVIRGSQKRYNIPVGRFFVEMGLFSDEAISKSLEEMKQHNRQFSLFDLVKI